MTSASRAGAPRLFYYGWTIVAATVVAQVAGNFLSYNTFSLFVRGWSREFQVPPSQLVLAIAALVFVAAPLSPVVGMLADKYPPRRLFAAGLVGTGLFYMAVSFVQQAWQIVALFALLGAPMLTLCTSVPSNALISRWFVRHIGLALGLSAFGIGLGGVLMPPVVAALLPAVGWRLIWRGSGLVLIAVIMPLVVLAIRERPGTEEGAPYLGGGGEAAAVGLHGHAPAAGSDFGWRDVLSRRAFWLLVVIYLAIMSTGSAMVQNVGPYVASRGLSDANAGVLLSVMSLAHMAATLVLGMAADRFGTRLPLAGLALAVAGGLLLFAFGHGFAAIAVGAALIGCNSAVFTPLAAALAVEFGARGFGRAFGLALFFLPVGTPVSFLVARLQERTGSYVPALMVCVTMLLVAAGLSLLLRDGRRDPPQEA